MKVIVSHPSSGALYAFFAQFNKNRLGDVTTRDPHPYYRTLYGDNFPRYQELALTLLLLFDEVVIVPADAYLPGGDRTEDGYFNAELGVRTAWRSELLRQLDDEIRQDLEDKEILRVLARVPPQSREQILRDTRYEIHIAQELDFPIVCVGGRRRIIELILQREVAKARLHDLPKLRMTEEYLRMTGPVFSPTDIDTLAALRGDRELRSYAGAFMSAMERFPDSPNVRVELLKAMQSAIESATLSKRIAGVFEGTATALNVVGLVPVAGTVATIAGLASETAAKVLERRERSQRWFEFAGQIRRVASLKGLERRISQELTASREESST